MLKIKKEAASYEDGRKAILDIANALPKLRDGLFYLNDMKDHPEITQLFGNHFNNWNEIIDYINKNGLQVYGFTAVVGKETILKISKDENISYVYTAPLP